MRYTRPVGEAPRVVVAGWAGSTNLGDELVLEALGRKLRAAGATPVVVSQHPSRTVADQGLSAVGPAPWAVARAARDAAGLVFGGGGLLQDETSPFNLPYHLVRPTLARAVGRPVVGVGLGAGGLRSAVGRRLVRAALAGVPVAVRDEGSVAALVAAGLPPPVLAADLAVSLPRPQVAAQDAVAVSLRPWRTTGGVLPVAARRPTTPPCFVDKMAGALDAVADGTGLAVRFVALQADRDGPLHRDVADRMRAPSELLTPGREGVVAAVAACRVVVAMRYHAGIAALLGGRPSVLLGYSPKVPALAADVGRGAAARPAVPEAPADVLAAVREVLDRGDDVEAAYQRLVARERGNDAVLARLLG